MPWSLGQLEFRIIVWLYQCLYVSALLVFTECDVFELPVEFQCIAFLQMLPLMMLEVLRDFPGVPGIFLACILFASLR